MNELINELINNVCMNNGWATLHCHGLGISMVVGLRETVFFVRYARGHRNSSYKK
jgi:hypothetical protein